MSSFSVIVPCYRYAHFLRDCVDSALKQPGVHVRVLIIDDASPDNTPEVAATLTAEDRRVEFTRHQSNRGHIATYNEGLEWADGDYTVLLSADDLLTPGALARAAAVLDAHPRVGFVYGRAVKFSTMPPPAARELHGAARVMVTPGLEWLAARCEDGWFSKSHRLISPEAIMRTSLNKHLGGYRPSLPATGDLEMWMRFAVHSDVAYLPDADQAYYRVHGENMHTKVLKDPLRETQQRKAAFDTIFIEYGDSIPDLGRLRERAYRKLADDSLATGAELFDDGRIASDVLTEFLRFAKDTYYRDGRTRSYAGIYARQLLGRRPFRALRSVWAAR